MNDKNLGILLLAVVVILLGISLIVNIGNTLKFLADPLAGKGLGKLCKNEAECFSFCLNNKGICNDYCLENPSNSLCSRLFEK